MKWRSLTEMPMLHANTLTLEWRWNGYWQLVCGQVRQSKRMRIVRWQQHSIGSEREREKIVYIFYAIVWQSAKRVTDWISLLKDLISPIEPQKHNSIELTRKQSNIQNTQLQTRISYCVTCVDTGTLFRSWQECCVEWSTWKRDEKYRK